MSEKITPERIAELRALLEKATPGPWRVSGQRIRVPQGMSIALTDAPAPLSDFDLIASAVNALPSLLDAAEENGRLRGELDWTQRMARACGASIGKYEGGRS